MKRVLGILLVISAFFSVSYSQAPFFQHYILLRKNDPVQVNTIFQDRNGFMWFGTNKGLFKYDGINQVRFTVQDSLPDNPVTAISQDSLGRIWTGHKNGKLAFIDNGTVNKFDPPEGLASAEISDILFDKHGNLWFSTLNDGLYCYAGNRLYRLDEQEGMPDLFVYDMEEDKEGNIWAGTDGGIAICTLHDKKVSIKVINHKQGLPDNIVKKIIRNDDNTVWIGTEDAGIINYNPTTGKNKPAIEDWNYGSVTDFIISDDKIWISSKQNGLLVYNVKTEKLKLYDNKVGFGFNSITTLLNDREGNIWTGSRTGVMRTLGDHVEYIESFDQTPDVNVLALTIDKNDNIWFSNKEGLFKRSADGSTERPLVKSSFQKYTVISLYADVYGYIWAGLYGEGALRINPANGKIKYLKQELRNGNVLNISGKDDVVWLATLGGTTQIKIYGKELVIKNYTHEDGLSSDYIYQVFTDSQNRVWFGTDGNGVDMLDAKGFHHYEEGLKSKVIYGFAEDGDHNIWVNTQSDGLFKFDGKRFQELKKDNAGRNDTNINCLTTDAFGNLVMMHDLEIDIFNIRKNKTVYLGDEVGIRDRMPNLNAIAKDIEGNIFFGTDGGIVKYTSIDQELPSPIPVIEGVTVLDQNIPISQHLKFSHEENYITLRFMGLWYRNPTKLKYAYQLENYDLSWIASTNHSVTYSSLPPGHYTFRLKVSDSEDFTDAKETSIHFVITPPFWRTNGFYVLSLVVIVLLVYAVIQYRERRLRKDKKLLEEKVLARTLEIQMKTEEIQAQNEEIQAQADQIQGINENLETLVQQRTSELQKKNKALEESAFIIAHELRAPVASILGLINLITKTELDEHGKTIVKHLDDSAEKLNTIVRTITKAIERGDE